MKNVNEEVKNFKKKYPITIAWRLSKNSSIIDKHLCSDEKLIYSFAAQKTNWFFDIFSTAVVAITNKRIIIGRKRLIFGYFFDSIMPHMFNDLNIKVGMIWGKVYIDTVKEFVVLSKIDKRALVEIESNTSHEMMKLKKHIKKI